jgi:hypothetical protein
MFNLRTESRSQLKRIVVAGTGGILLGMVLIALNLVLPLVAATGYEPTNIAFGAFGIVVVVLATHPTYQAAERLDST